MRAPEPIVLENEHVRLEPLAESHLADLLVAGADPEVWRWLPVPRPSTLADHRSRWPATHWSSAL